MSVLFAILAIAAAPLSSASAEMAADKNGRTIIRSQKDMSISIDGKSHLSEEALVAADVQPHTAYPSLEEQEVLAQHAESQSKTDDPCRYLGCNSHKCEWVTGEVLMKVETKKACHNAKALTPKKDRTIETLTQCLRAVKSKLETGLVDGEADNSEAAVLVDGPEQCSTYFEMHMETNQCSCVPADTHCDEKEDEKVCRFKFVKY